ncbi:MAG TPA: hypothetical protein VLG50_00450 [Candidatus Saccharimonadales bacterium]|nr:hypothetical protein [Candidatus Saccharimonadales bacterium]
MDPRRFFNQLKQNAYGAVSEYYALFSGKLQHTPYNQGSFCNKSTNLLIKEGMCGGAAILQVTDTHTEERAAQLQIECLLSINPSTKASKLFIEEHGLQEQVNPVQRSYYPSNDAKFLEEHSKNFSSKATFFCVLRGEKKERAGHMLRFNSLGEEAKPSAVKEVPQCSLYDANNGLYTGQCPVVIEQYNRLRRHYGLNEPGEMSVISYKPAGMRK